MNNVNQQKKSTKKKKSGLKITLLKKNSGMGSYNEGQNDDIDALPKFNQDELKSKNKAKIERMRHRSDKKKCILYT